MNDITRFLILGVKYRGICMRYQINYNSIKDAYTIEYYDDEGLYHYIEEFLTEEMAREWAHQTIDSIDDWK